MSSPFVEDSGSGGWSGNGGGSSGGGDKRSVQEGDDGYWQAATGSVTTATTLAVADAITQLTVQRKSPADLSLARISRMALFGLIIKGPLSFVFYQAVDFQFPGKRFQCVTWKLLLDQGPWSVFINMAFLFTLPVFEGRGIAAGRRKALDEIIDMQTQAYKLWPAVHLFNYALVPPQGTRSQVSCPIRLFAKEYSFW